MLVKYPYSTINTCTNISDIFRMPHLYSLHLNYVWRIFTLADSDGLVQPGKAVMSQLLFTAAGPEHLVHFPHQQGTENRPKIQLECNFKLLHCIMSWFPIQWPYPPAGKDSRTKP